MPWRAARWGALAAVAICSAPEVPAADTAPPLKAKELRVIDGAFARYDSGDTVLVHSNGTVEGNLCVGKAGAPCEFTSMPRLRLRLQNGAYRFAPELMRERPADEARLMRYAAIVRGSPKWQMPGRPVPIEVVLTMAKLIYSGNAAQALRFVDAAWPQVRNDRDAFLHDFYVCRVQRSRYWLDIAALNGIPIEILDTASCPTQSTTTDGIGWAMHSLSMGGHRFFVFDHDSGQELLEIYDDFGRPVMRRWGGRVSLTPGPAPLPWTNRKGVRIAIDNYSAHPRYEYIFIDIQGDAITSIADIEIEEEAKQFVDLDDRPGVEMVLFDRTLSPMADELGNPTNQPVVLRFRHGHYLIDTDLMRKRPLDPGEFWDRVQQVRIDVHGRYPSLREFDIRRLRAAMANLIYSGNAGQALQLADAAWPREIEGKDEFLRDFYRCRLRSSQYWPVIATMNNLLADPPEGDCPN